GRLSRSADVHQPRRGAGDDQRSEELHPGCRRVSAGANTLMLGAGLAPCPFAYPKERPVPTSQSTELQLAPDAPGDNSAHYIVIPQSMEWLWVLSRLYRTLPPKSVHIQTVRAGTWPWHFIPRAHVSPEALAQRLGGEADAIAAAPYIQLLPLAGA